MAKLNTGSFAITVALLSVTASGPGSTRALAYGTSVYAPPATSGNGMGAAMMMMAGGMGGSSGQYNCAKSGEATNEKMSTQCQNSKSYMTYATVSNLMGQQLGAAAQQTAGQLQLQNAMMAPQQNALAVQAQANASLAETGAMTQLGLGAMNAAWGAYLMKRAGTHSGNASSLTDAKGSKSLNQIQANRQGSTLDNGKEANQNGYVTAPNGSYSANILQANSFNSSYNQDQGIATTFASNDPRAAELMRKRQNEISSKESAARKLVSSTLAQGANEQTGMANNLKATGILNTVMGAAQVANGGMSMMAAAEAQNAARELAALSASPLPNFAPVQGNVLTPTATAAVSPGALAPGSNPGPTPTPSGGGLVPTSGAGTLGTPFGNNTPTLATGPTPQPYGPNMNQNQQQPFMGGGPIDSGGGGGTTPPAKADNQNNSPTPANNRLPSFYGGGGTYTGGVAAGVGADKGPDLSGLLAQFLPKKEDASQQKGIMSFTTASRSPASEPYSYLGREVNLFERVSEAILDNTRRGTVGI